MSKGVRSLLACGMLTALVLVPGSPATATSNVHAMKVFVGYADGIRGDSTVPSPWDGDAGVRFIGAGDVFDAGAIRIVDPSRRPLTIDDVSVDIGSATYDLWGPYPIVVAGKSSLVLTQTAEWNSRPIRNPIPAAPRPITIIFRPLLRQSPTRVTAE